MSCLEDRKNVRKFLEDLLEESEYQRVRRHVEACGACAQFVRAAGSVSSMLMELGHASGPDDLPDAVLYRYDLKRRVAAAPSLESPIAPPASFAVGSEPTITAPGSAGASGWLKFVAVLLVFLVAGLAWRDWVQTRLLEALLEKKYSSGVLVAPAEPSVPVNGDFQWGNVHIYWPGTNREMLLNFIRPFFADIRYEAPGLVVARVPADRDAQWRAALREVPGVTIAGEIVSSAESGDRLYSIEYQES